MNNINELEKAMMAKFNKADEAEKLRNMSQADLRLRKKRIMLK